jgi:hypothetical protein
MKEFGIDIPPHQCLLTLRRFVECLTIVENPLTAVFEHDAQGSNAEARNLSSTYTSSRVASARVVFVMDLVVLAYAPG